MLDRRLFQSATRSVTVSYPGPLIFVASLAFALVCLGGAMVSADALRWVFVGFAVIGAAFGIGFVGLTAIFRPHLLRSEGYSMAHAYLEFLTAQDVDDSTRDSAEKVIIGLSGPTASRLRSRPEGNPRGEQKMNQRMYVIVFDLSTIATTIVRRLFKSNRDIFHRWWNHLPFAFLVVSDRTAEEITGFLHERVNEASFLIAEIDLRNANGILPDRSWEWIVERANELALAENH